MTLPVLALLQEHAEKPAGLMDIRLNIIFWTMLIFGVVYWVLSRSAFPAIFKEVEAREKALADAIEAAKRDREEAAKLLAEHKAAIDGARNEAQKLIADGRAVAEKMRVELIEKTRSEQTEMIERARRDIGIERDKAIVELRREAVDLAIKGASKVVEENLDSDKNRKLVESFLSTLSTSKTQS